MEFWIIFIVFAYMGGSCFVGTWWNKKKKEEKSKKQ